MFEGFSNFINETFGPPLEKIFHPTHAVFDAIPEDLWTYFAKGSAVGLFVLAMIWVFLLKREYVNIDAPTKHVWHDLRFWTIVSMLPHVIVYIML